MRHLKTWWLLVIVFLSFPYVLLYLAGSVWLWQRGLFWQWGVLAAIMTAASWWWAKRLARLRRAPAAFRPSPRQTGRPPDSRPGTGRSHRPAQEQDLPIDRPEPLWNLLREVLETVARAFYPRSRRAIPRSARAPRAPDRRARRARLPRRLFRKSAGRPLPDHARSPALSRLAGWWTPLYAAYRVGSFAVNPLAAVIREARDLAAGKLVDASIEEIRRWAIGFCVRKAGFYAIQLYSGQLLLESPALDDFRPPAQRVTPSATAANRSVWRVNRCG